MTGFVCSLPSDYLEKSGLELSLTMKGKKKRNQSEKPVLKNRVPRLGLPEKARSVRSSGPRLVLPGGRWEYLWDFQIVGWCMSEKGNL